MQLIELLIGDNTRAGFVVNFWLNSASSDSESGIAEKLARLRVQDIVLLRNVALSTFRGKVYGQSLRKGQTRCELMYRRKVDRRDAGGCYAEEELVLCAAGEGMHPQMEKTAMVREWVVKFVGAPVTRKVVREETDENARDTKGKRRMRSIVKIKEVLPPDTQ